MVQSILKSLALTLVALTLFSCGKDPAISSPNEGIRVIDAEISTLQISFPNVLSKYSWAGWYAESMYRYMNERPELESLFTTEINQYDLRLLRCGNFNELSAFQKKRFWILYLASIAYVESGLNPNQTFRETDGSLSSGLLQIDRASANRHSTPYTGFVFSQNDLYSPDLNLMAGLYILKHQLEGGMNGERPDIRGRLFTNSSYYWSVLTLKREMIIKSFTQNARVNLPFCSIGE